MQDKFQDSEGNDSESLDRDPLVSYLEPRFGSIRSYEDWTPRLARATTQYLMHELSDDSYSRLVAELSVDLRWKAISGRRDLQAKEIIANHRPAEVAHAAHFMAVRGAPSFEVLVASILAEPETTLQDYIDATEWLDANATNDQRAALLQEIDLAYLLAPPEDVSPSGVWLVDWLEWRVGGEQRLPDLSQLLHVWQRVRG